MQTVHGPMVPCPLSHATAPAYCMLHAACGVAIEQHPACYVAHKTCRGRVPLHSECVAQREGPGTAVRYRAQDDRRDERMAQRLPSLELHEKQRTRARNPDSRSGEQPTLAKFDSVPKNKEKSRRGQRGKRPGTTKGPIYIPKGWRDVRHRGFFVRLLRECGVCLLSKTGPDSVALFSVSDIDPCRCFLTLFFSDRHRCSPRFSSSEDFCSHIPTTDCLFGQPAH